MQCGYTLQRFASIRLDASKDRSVRGLHYAEQNTLMKYNIRFPPSSKVNCEVITSAQCLLELSYARVKAFFPFSTRVIVNLPESSSGQPPVDRSCDGGQRME